MAVGLAPKLPLYLDANGGFSLHTNFRDLIRQNFKNLLLTSPGERIMMPDFGVGLMSFIFEQETSVLKSRLDSKIREQVKKYIPAISIITTNIISNRENPELSPNSLYVGIKYAITPLGINDLLEITVNSEG